MTHPGTSIVGRALGVLLIGLVAPPALVFLGASGQPELAVRTVPVFTHTGRLLASQPPGERFRCRYDGLARFDVRAIALGPLPDEALELVLNEIGPDGPREIRRARFQPGRDTPRGGMLSFDFEPVEDSAGHDFEIELSPAEGVDELDLGLWMRPRAARGASAPWGPDALDGPRYELRFQSPHPDLSGLALAFVHLEPEHVVRVALTDADSGATLRTAELSGRALRDGYALVRFDPPLAESYGRALALSIELPPGAVLRGEAGTPSWAALHGAYEADPALGGMTLDGRALEGVDLVLRVFTDADRPAAVAARLPPRLWAAWLVWIALVAAALSMPWRAFALKGAA